MIYDDDLDERRVPTMRSALEDFVEVLARPAAKRLTAAVEWCGRVRRLEIDWTHFGCTRGGYFDWLGTPLVYKPDRPPSPSQYRVVGPVLQFSLGEHRWRPWAKWWPGFDWSFSSYLPQIQAQRGGIQILQAAAPTWADEPIEFDLPFDSSEPMPYLAPRVLPPLET